MQRMLYAIQNFLIPNQDIALTDMCLGLFAIFISYVIACVPLVIILFLIEIF